MTGSIVVKIELPIDLYGQLARATKGEVGRLLRTLATRAARMESEELKSIAPPTAQPEDELKHQLAAEQIKRDQKRVEFIKSELDKSRKVIDIAKDLGLSDTRVRQYMKANSLEPTAREQIRRTEAERDAAIRELWFRHHTGADIVRILQIPKSTVYKTVARLNREDRIS